MAAGDITFFDQFLEDEGNGVHNLDADVIKLGLFTSTITPTASDATPAWGASSGVDYDGNEVTTGTSYSAGGPDITATFSQTAGTATLDATNVVIAQDASGFTNARWGLIYNETATNNEAIGFLDLGSDRSIQSGSLTINWHASGIGTKT